MEASALIDQLATATTPTDAKEILSPHKGQPGLSEAFFKKVAALTGAAPERAIDLSRHWQAVKRYGDEPAYAYRAKAVGERAQGLWLRSARSFQKAGLVAKSGVDKLSFQLGAVDSLARADRFDEAVSLGRRLVRGLDALGEQIAAARARLNLGNALLWQDKYRLAMRQFEAAIEPLEQASLEVDAAAAKVGLSTSHLLGGDLQLAEKYAAEARAVFQEIGLDYYSNVTATTLAQKALLTGRADTALDLLLQVRSHIGDASPTDAARIHEFIGDAYYRLNLWQEGVDSYEAALSVKGPIPVLNRGNCLFGIGLAQLGIGNLVEAQRMFRRARAAFRKAKNQVWTGVVTSYMSRVHLASGETAKALERAKDAEDLLRGTRSWFRLAECRLDLAEALLESGHDPSGMLRSASTLIQKHGLAAHAWRPHAINARAAAPKARLQHYRRMLDRMLEARLLTSSTHSRISFLADKAKYVKLYLDELFSQPNRRKVREGLDVILRTRSVALLEEILAAGLGPGNATLELERLREELNALSAGEMPSSGSRLQTVETGRAANLQRRWIEATRSAQATAELALSDVDAETVVLIEASDNLYALCGDRVTKLPLTGTRLREEIRWLEFDLLSPAVGGLQSATAETALHRLAGSLAAPWYAGQRTVLLSPDGILWRVPWQACLRTLDPEVETLIALHPSASIAAGEARLPKKPKAALWLYEGGDLPHARREAEMFLSIFPEASVSRSLAETRAMLNEGLDLLHVATHAKLNPENPMFSYLQFSDGRLHAAEIAAGRLRADIVTLSACETARMSLSVQDEPEGLARAFLARSAKAVLGSSWALDDEAAAHMMEPYYRSLAAGSSVSGALRVARDIGRAWRQHPYYWGSLVVFPGYPSRSYPVS